MHKMINDQSEFLSKFFYLFSFLKSKFFYILSSFGFVFSFPGLAFLFYTTHISFVLSPTEDKEFPNDKTEAGEGTSHTWSF